MSQPASLIVRCQISVEGLRLALNARAPRASDWRDWAALEIGLTAAEMADLDRRTGCSLADYLRELRGNGEVPADWLFAHDAPSRTLSIGRLLFTDNMLEVIAGLALLRRLGAGLSAGQQGLILVQDTVFRQAGTLAAVSLSPGGSAVVPAGRLALDPGAFAAPVLDPIRILVDREVPAPGPLRDDLDRAAG